MTAGEQAEPSLAAPAPARRARLSLSGRPRLIAVLVGLAWAVAATTARATVGMFTPSGPPLAFVFPAVLIATLQTGWLGGTVTLFAAEAAAAFLYIPQLKTTDLGSMSSAERLIITFLIGLALLVIAQRHRDLGRRAAEAEKAAARAREEAHQESADRMRLLVHEVDHRANNLMSVMQGLVSLSHATSAAELKAVIEGRLHALAKAHKLMSETRWQGADLRRLVTEELTPFGLGSTDRVQADGDNVALSAAAAQGMALALHELATNAVKHGALSNASGEVRVSWSSEGGLLKLSWRESGGPAAKRPGRTGTGLKVLQRAFEGSAAGRTELDWDEGGLTCSIEAPLS
jgi:two-component sensor histidine kinase